MPQHRNAVLRQFLKQARRIADLERQQLQQKIGFPLPQPPWPHAAFGPNLYQINKIISTPEESIKHLLYRLKKFPYPYPLGTKKHKTFYLHVKSLGLLDFLLKPPFLWKVRAAWFLRIDYDHEKQAKVEGRSPQYGHPIAFHRDVLNATSGYLSKLRNISKKYGVREDWFKDYFVQINKELLREAAVCYPELLRWHKPNSRFSPALGTVDTQLEIFGALVAVFKKRGQDNNKLAFQLTALICSSQDSIRAGKLDPSPEAIRRNMLDRKKARKK